MSGASGSYGDGEEFRCVDHGDVDVKLLMRSHDLREKTCHDPT